MPKLAPLLITWMWWCAWVFEAAKVVDAPSTSAVVATATKEKIDSFLVIVFMLPSEQRYSLYEVSAAWL